MLIDWFTVGAQALNFVILVWLMKHFLYKPILHAIDAREKLIATELAEAAAKKAEADKERGELAHKNEELDQQRAGMLNKATDDANAERKRLVDEARTTADALSAKRQETLRTDAKNLEQAIRRRTEQEVFAIARKALADLATTDLEERMAAVFTRRLRELNGVAKASLAKAIETASDAATVRSAFELPPDQRAVIQNALNETFSADVRIQFETAPDLVSGIELSSNGQKIGWTIADYLKSLQEGVDDLLKKKVEAEMKTEAPKPEPAKAAPNGTTTPKANGAPAKTESEAPKPKLKVDPKPGTTAEPEPTSKPEPKEDAKPPVSDTNAESKPEPTADAKPSAPDTNAESKPEPTADAKPSAPGTKTDSKPVVKAKPEAAAEAAARPEVKPPSRAEAKPGAPTPEAKRP